MAPNLRAFARMLPADHETHEPCADRHSGDPCGRDTLTKVPLSRSERGTLQVRLCALWAEPDRADDDASARLPIVRTGSIAAPTARRAPVAASSAIAVSANGALADLAVLHLDHVADVRAAKRNRCRRGRDSRRRCRCQERQKRYWHECLDHCELLHESRNRNDTGVERKREAEGETHCVLQ